MSDVMYLNQNAVSWNHLRFTISRPDTGVVWRCYGFHSLDFGGEKRERALVYGQNLAQAPLAISAGKYTPPSPKVGFLVHSLEADDTAPFDSYLEMLAVGNPVGPSGFQSYGDTRTNWNLQIVNRQINIMYQWFGVHATEVGGSWEETAEGLKREVSHMCMRFAINGKTVYDSSQE